ncbi:MAG: acyltransferase family protein [Ilumatobacteraceae bacterium]
MPSPAFSDTLPKFRQDIQGLRGIAVLLVVIYHTGLGLPWGFVGVDVFFVVSGFVITQLLVGELEKTGRIRFREFYARRARRLLPALAIVTVFVLLASVILMSPYGEQQQVAKTSQAASLFVANAYLFLQESYFAMSLNPFRHTWSLAVEEQFYLFFPAFLVGLWKLGNRFTSVNRRIFVACCLVMISLVSFVLSVLLSFGFRLVQLPTRFAFFGTPARIWEFGVGVVLALLLPFIGSVSQVRGLLFGVSGVLVFLLTSLRISSFTPFPGVVALGPVFGTGLLILAGSKSRVVYRVLAVPPLNVIGDVSYGWYIWHWPLIVFADIVFPASTTAMVISALIALVVAFVSYRLVEHPIRTNHAIVGLRAIRLVAICVIGPLLVSGIVLVGARTGLGLPSSNTRDHNPSLADVLGCQATDEMFDPTRCVVLPNTEDTSVANDAKTVLLIGDSQAGAASDGVANAASQLGMKFAVWYNNGCPVFPRPTDERDDCPFFQSHLRQLISLTRPSVIVVANSSTLYTTRGAQRGGLTIRLDSGELAKNFGESVQSWVEGMRAILGSDLFSSIPVILLQEVPSSDFTRVSLFRRTVQESVVSLNYFYDRNHVVSKERLYLEELNNLELLDPADVICPNGQCISVLAEHSIYGDQYHLSPFGSRLLTDKLTTLINSLVGGR